eukprot:TRINITY_DN6635_c0_g1_i5.p8 TRINITY_DN6635_c0_g1~~TRINITY_DN6635_c0_g1_i5.p8  ORF type:complete len:115 (-),score=20.12 TRINITY_DN6635_c0_g1_i5:906-1250(-)
MVGYGGVGVLFLGGWHVDRGQGVLQGLNGCHCSQFVLGVLYQRRAQPIMSSGQTLGVKAQRFRGHTSPHRNVKEKKKYYFCQRYVFIFQLFNQMCLAQKKVKFLLLFYKQTVSL